jgi:hypothetical protein
MIVAKVSRVWLSDNTIEFILLARKSPVALAQKADFGDSFYHSLLIIEVLESQ